MTQAYVHGYDLRENIRLQDQAYTLVDLLHSDTHYPEGSKVLEAGCGVGAQTVTLAANSPGAAITSIDISAESVEKAKAAVTDAGFNNVEFMQADILDLAFEENSFDHIFVCFVLEHLPDPVGSLKLLARVLKPGGTITLIEGDHGSTYFYPDSPAAHKAISCQVRLQAMSGGNAEIGRQLYPLLNHSDFKNIKVSPRMVYADPSRPELVDGFTRKTFTAMIEGVRKPAIDAGLTDPDEFDRGISDLYRAAGEDGVFCYTFFKAVAIK